MKSQFQERTLRELAKVGKLDAEKRKKLAAKLFAMEQHIYPFEAIAELVRGTLSDDDSKEPDELAGAISSFLFAAASASSQTPKQLLEETSTELRAANSSAVADATVAFLRELISHPNLLVSFKGTSHVDDGDRLLIDSKLYVDVRPVFDPLGDSTSILASVLLYRLRLVFRSSSGDPETMLFTLREEELSELGEVITRAKSKTTAIKGSSKIGKLLESRK